LSGSRFSRHQFAILLCLIECFPEKLTPTIIYDPEFNQEDEKIIGQFLPESQICDVDATKKVKSLILEFRTKSIFDQSSIQ